jgi:NAD(P)-dependent dehydrogenase (short-subunit alcohol dehydrogenase family)
VVLADLDAEGLERASAELSKTFGRDQVRTVRLDVTAEEETLRAFLEAAVEYGGLDIAVPNAGISSAAPVDETELSMWRRNIDILATGYFLTSREAFRLMKRQGIGGAMVFIASKNGLAASPNASAYCTAKAAEIHLARCLALEGAPLGIRANTVNPDAVLQGSRIWGSGWREERAAAYGIEPEELEDYYRQRNVLKLNVLPENIAEAVLHFASEARSSRSTGNVLNVDGGVKDAYPR